MRRASVLRALLAAFGRQFLVLGLLKLLNDALNFAGPLLMNGLLLHLASRRGGATDDGAWAGVARAALCWRRPDPASPEFGAACAVLLAASLLSKVRASVTLPPAPWADSGPCLKRGGIATALGAPIRWPSSSSPARLA